MQTTNQPAPCGLNTATVREDQILCTSNARKAAEFAVSKAGKKMCLLKIGNPGQEIIRLS